MGAPLPPSGGTLAAQATGIDRLAGAGIVLAAALLGAGLSLPIMSIDRFFLFEQRVSIIDALLVLAGDGEWLLALVVGLFSILFPVLKLALAWWLWQVSDLKHPGLGRQLEILATVGKWSMLDVFLAALIIAAIKISFVSDVEVHYGLYLFAASVLLSTVICQRLSLLAARHSGQPPGPAP